MGFFALLNGRSADAAGQNTDRSAPTDVTSRPGGIPEEDSKDTDKDASDGEDCFAVRAGASCTLLDESWLALGVAIEPAERAEAHKQGVVSCFLNQQPNTRQADDRPNFRILIPCRLHFAIKRATKPITSVQDAPALTAKRSSPPLASLS